MTRSLIAYMIIPLPRKWLALFASWTDQSFIFLVEENDADPAPGLCNACKLCGVYKKYRNIQNKLATIYCKQCKYCNYGYYVRFFKRLPYKKIVRYVRWITKWGRRRRSWVRRRRRRRRVSRRRRRRRRRRRW